MMKKTIKSFQFYQQSKSIKKKAVFMMKKSGNYSNKMSFTTFFLKIETIIVLISHT